MNSTDTRQRRSKYCLEIVRLLAAKGHATNAELLESLRTTYPELSATTVHRATSRLADRGEIGIAPAAKDGAMRYDATITPHDHFQCTSCFRLRDTQVKDKIVPILEAEIGDCSISGQLTISGLCKACK